MQKHNFYDLTNPQKSIWVTEEYFKGSAINNICGTALIKEKVNLILLEKSIIQVLNNNDIFKIKFCINEGKVEQYVSDYVNSDIVYFHAKNYEQFENIKNEIVSRPFHLLNSHPYNFYIITFPNGNAAFSLNIHHILADAWTLGFLSKQVIKTYCALLQIDIPYKCETYSYIDYINSENKYKKSERFLKDKTYWNKEFETIPELPFIPGSINNPSHQEKIVAKRAQYNINSKTVSKIKKYCNNNSISLFNFFMAIYSIYIRGITGLDNFVIGTPILNRTNYKEKNTAGMFINMAAFRVDFSKSTTFKDFIKNIASKSVGMLKHQKYSYQSLIEDLREKNGNIPTLYNTVFSYQITSTQSEEIFVDFSTDWTFNGNSAENMTIQVFDLDDSGELTITYDYKTSIYSAEDITAIHNRISYLLTQVISKKDVKLRDLEIITKKEKNLILNKFNNTKALYDSSKTLIDLFEKQVNKTSENTAVIYDSKQYSYKELNNMSNIVANTIGDIRGKKIAVLCKKSAWTLASFLGIMKSGNCYIPVDPEYPEDRIQYILQNSEASILITSHDNDVSFKSKIYLEDLEKSEEILFKNRAKPEDLAYIIYTSGTTGNPKGVKIKHKNIINTLLWRKNYYKFNENTTVYQVPSFSFDSSVEDIFTPLISGSKLIIPSTLKIDVNQMCEDIQKYNVQNFLVVPSLYKILLKEKWETIKTLKFVTIAGEDFNISLVREHFEKLPNVRLVNEYGPTENSVCSTYYELTPNDTEILIGKPISNCKCYCLNNSLGILPFGTPGELYVSGPGVSEGYLNMPDITKQRFLDNPFGGKYKLYKTGDVVEYSKDGNLKFIGRNDNQIKLHGYRIELKEIENNILKNADISDVFVTKKIDLNNKPTLVAYVIAKSKKLDISVLHNDLKESLPQYMIPNIVQIEKFPLTPNGKIDAKALPLPEVKKSKHTSPVTNLEQQILDICRNVIKNSKLQIEDDFFEVGGADSLDILTINSKLFENNIKLNTQSFYKYPTVKELANYLSKEMYDSFSEDEQIIKPKSMQVPSKINKKDICFNYKNIFLTGTTGFLGIHILDYLLKNTNCIIYCFLRKKQNSSSEKRLENVLAYYFNKDYYNQYKSRIIILEGDLSKDRFDLPNEVYTVLQKKIDCIINTAANTKHYGSYSNFEKSNVISVKNLISFAKPSNIILNHISTTSISGNYLVDNDIFYNFTENDFYIGQNYKSNVYIHSKFEAEKVILEQGNELTFNIFRLGNLMARYSDGMFQKNKFDNAYYTRLLALAKFGYLPNNLKNQKLEFSPIDETAEAIIKLLSIPNTKNNIFHVFSNKLVNIDVLLDLFKKYNYPCKFIDYDNFINKLYLQKDEKILKYVISDLNSSKKFDYSSNIIIDQSITNDFLKLASFNWSNIDEDYLKRFFDKTNFTKDIEL